MAPAASRRLCARPGCSALGSAWAGFDSEWLIAWIDPARDDEPLGAMALCERHADTLTVPRGWHVEDRRADPQPLWVEAPTHPAEQPTRPLRRSRRRRPGASRPQTLQPTLEGVAASHRADTLQTSLEGVLSRTWEARFDLHDDLGGVLAARGRLLARAFGER